MEDDPRAAPLKPGRSGAPEQVIQLLRRTRNEVVWKIGQQEAWTRHTRASVTDSLGRG